MLNLIASALVAVLVFSVYRYISNKRARKYGDAKPLPGPKGLPYAGVPHKVPPTCPWIQFTEWSKEYGPIYQLKIMGEDIVVITDKEILEELFVKRKANFSSRPDYPALPGANHDMRYLPLLAAGESHKRARKFAAHILAKIPQPLLVDVSTSNSKEYVRKLLENPNDGKALTELYASRITSQISWGDASAGQQNAETAWRLMHSVSPGATIMSKLPFLQHAWHYLPDVLQPWKVYELDRRRRERDFWLAQQSKSRSSAAASPDYSLMREFYRARDRGISDEEEAANAVGMLTVIGSLLLSTPVETFLIAMCHHPSWQAAGAAELDAVCPGRLPTPADLARLPTLRAIIRELHRWRPPVPIGAPHASLADDTIHGYRIPAGASVLSLCWAFERDPALFPDPDAFRPERWLDPAWPTYREPLAIYPAIKNHNGFGWGARMCLGQDFTEVVNLIMIGTLLATVEVSKAVDEESGEEIEVPTMDYEPFTIFVRPYPWKMQVKLRSEKKMELLK